MGRGCGLVRLKVFDWFSARRIKREISVSQSKIRTPDQFGLAAKK
jgi:hypothetical protein